jgi:hypothetical protein
MDDIELLTRKVETSHWKKEEISLHAAAKQASFSLASERCKCKGTCRCRKSVFKPYGFFSIQTLYHKLLLSFTNYIYHNYYYFKQNTITS